MLGVKETDGSGVRGRVSGKVLDHGCQESWDARRCLRRAMVASSASVSKYCDFILFSSSLGPYDL